MEHDNPMVRLRAAQAPVRHRPTGEDGPDGGNNQLIVQPKYPIGTDPLVMRKLEAEVLERAGVQPPGAPPKRDRGRIFNDALLQAVGRKDKVQPKEVKDALTTEDGDTPEIVVDGEVPEILNEDRRGRGDE